VDSDSPWKEALDIYFQAFLLLLFPTIHNDIDWSRPIEMLDKESQRLVPGSLRGRRTVGKLVKVWRENGRPAWVLIHVEVQAQQDRTFARRMAIYNGRIFDRYDCDVASLAILADDNLNWRPIRFQRDLWGCRASLAFPTVKLLDFAGREAELEASANPFAKIVLAHLKTLQTRDDPPDRHIWKFRIARGLHECGFATEDVQQLLKFVEWLMQLPEALERDYEQELRTYEEERRVPFLASFERRTIHGLIEEALRAKFGEEGLELMPEITEMRDLEKYKTVNRVIAIATTLDEVREACAAASRPASKKKSTRPRRPKP
jgi:hypothetical protein